MTGFRVVLLVVVLAAAAVRIWRRTKGRRHGRAAAGDGAGSRPAARRVQRLTTSSEVLLVAEREARERLRGRTFRVATLVILAVVAAAIVIPVATRSKATPTRVAVVGSLPAPERAALHAAARSSGTTVQFVPVAGLADARHRLQDGSVDVAVVGGRALVVESPISPSDTSTTAKFVQAATADLGTVLAFRAAGLSPGQVERLVHARRVPVSSVQAARPAASHGKSADRSAALIGIILLFVMLNQYNTWILMGVMEEKATRVVEVLLSCVRPIELVGGKVLGIGALALGQAGLVAAFAFVLARAVGSNALSGTAPDVILATLLWLVLGYALYCWVYAAAGSLVERQDQVQALALPLSLPLIAGYVLSLSAVATGSASTFFEVLAYFPPTAPFAMPVLVALGLVSWWQFLASVLLTLAATVAMARLAAVVYRRAVLRTGGRVRLREVLRPAA